MDKAFEPDKEVLSGYSLAIIWTSILDTQDVELEARKLLLTDREHFHQKKQDVLEDFRRTMGFQRIGPSALFCFAKDPDHPSHSLLSRIITTLFRTKIRPSCRR